MGQAKNRGTYEERKAAAVIIREEEERVQREIRRRRPSPKMSRTNLFLAAVLGASGSLIVDDYKDLS